MNALNPNAAGAARPWALRLTTLLAALVLAGCATAPFGPGQRDAAADQRSDRAAAAAAVPATVDNAAVAGSAGAASPAVGAQAVDWHSLVRDERLARVIEQALAHNLDLKQAVLAIDAARAQYRVTRAGQSPTVSGSAAASVSGGDGQSTSRQVSVGLGVSSWEIDLWGRLADQTASAQANVRAVAASAEGVRTALVAETAQAWLTLQAQDALVRLAEATQAARSDTARVTGARHEAGVVTGLDVSTAEASVQSARLALAEARTAQAQARHALRALLGSDLAAEDAPPALDLGLTAATAAAATSATVSVASGGSAAVVRPQATAATPTTTTIAASSGEPATWPVALQSVPANLPASVLLARADVRSAEQSLVAARADVDAARAALWPKLSLTASTGLASAALGSLLSGGSFVWALAPALSVPLLDGGASKANLEGTQVAQQVALTQYQQAVQSAFTEVADALAVRQQLGERLDAQRRLVDAYGRSLALSQTRRQAGAESPLAVLSAQATWLTSQQALINLHLAEQSNRLTLYKVLGGA